MESARSSVALESNFCAPSSSHQKTKPAMVVGRWVAAQLRSYCRAKPRSLSILARRCADRFSVGPQREMVVKTFPAPSAMSRASTEVLNPSESRKRLPDEQQEIRGDLPAILLGCARLRER